MDVKSYIHNVALGASPWFAAGAMVALALLAFGIPANAFSDHADSSVSDAALSRLKTQSTAGYEVHPLFTQVTEAHMTGPTPDHVAGTVIWRTVFGIPVGQRYELNIRRWIAVWGAFVGAEIALGYIAFCRLAQDQ